MKLDISSAKAKLNEKQFANLKRRIETLMALLSHDLTLSSGISREGLKPKDDDALITWIATNENLKRRIET